jgi:hypothetical protein
VKNHNITTTKESSEEDVVFCPQYHQSLRFNLTTTTYCTGREENKKTKQKLESNRATRCSCAIRSKGGGGGGKTQTIIRRRRKKKKLVAVTQQHRGIQAEWATEVCNMTRLRGNSRRTRRGLGVVAVVLYRLHALSSTIFGCVLLFIFLFIYLLVYLDIIQYYSTPPFFFFYSFLGVCWSTHTKNHNNSKSFFPPPTLGSFFYFVEKDPLASSSLRGGINNTISWRIISETGQGLNWWRWTSF